ncbi:DAK2 domain-containing protein [Ruminococcus sp. OA3]|uniref:DAK2 domain-containing protein n=1 Tax=Ruminococcus sp. OA3 TaxID=2914164 RepID=UPI001F06DB70|nr:DAK2 domain-containing protein [Ruminococcus sp. OA3]MCH1981304.1 DAK2 domain-containing protein [Ruminococcus sp. OA3]
MVLDRKIFSDMMLAVARLWKENSDYLSNIDSKFGDGDHGITIAKIAAVLEKDVAGWGDKSIQEFFSDLGDDIMAVSGGSAGPLYGTMIGGLGAELKDETEVTPHLLKAMLRASLSEMQDISTAKVGDKTMMDSLIPAVLAAEAAGDSIAEILERAKEAAAQGAKDSEQYVARFGRAKSYKEQTIGTPDAGAVSTAIFFEGLAEGIK